MGQTGLNRVASGHRLAARREGRWARFKANNSLVCRNCHDLGYMNFTRQSTRAAEAHDRFLASGEKTCIDCHKGVAHKLTDMAEVEG